MSIETADSEEFHPLIKAALDQSMQKIDEGTDIFKSVARASELLRRVGVYATVQTLIDGASQRGIPLTEDQIKEMVDRVESALKVNYQ